jgi:hypothetical protein
MSILMSTNTGPAQRVICYVDGFNLYYGLRDSGFRRFLWLDVHSLAEQVKLPNQHVICTKYFTSLISGARPNDSPRYAAERTEKRKRQATYLDALRAHVSVLKIHFGHFLGKDLTCFACQSTWSTYEEKMTDVNIATEMLLDAYNDRFDTALLISADSDLVPPVRAIRAAFPEKRVVVAFPPGRSSFELKKAANAQFMISKGPLKRSQLPDEVSAGGFTYRRPASWC